MINVAKPFLPKLEELNKYFEGIWQRQWLTNNGPLVQELEEKLKEYLNVKHVLYVNNGTIALQIALKAIATKGKVITTPFSYVATTNSILWEGFTPVFADINNTDFNIDVRKIEPLITEETVAIMATHVYGNPCNIEAIEKIALKYGLKVIYDGAHSFGCKYNSKQVLAYGDITTCSFHATKIFHTVEGGAIITNNDELAEKMTLYRQFGHIGDDYYSIGINGKSSELHAAMGLCLLPKMNDFIEKRKALSNEYNNGLKNLPIQFPIALPTTEYNYSYYPIILDSEERVIKLKEYLSKNGVNIRRYFYPSLNKLPQYTGEDCPISESISLRAVALPLFYDLSLEEVQQICTLIKNIF